MKKTSQRNIAPYAKSALIVSLAFLIGFFAPRILAGESILSGGQVSVIGPVTNQRNLNEVIKTMQEIVGKDAKFNVEQQTRGDAGLQFVVALDGSIASVKDDELKQFGYLVTIEDGTNPYVTNLLDASSQPIQYYAFFEEDLEGHINLISLEPVHY